MKSERKRSWLKRIWMGFLLGIILFGFLFSFNSTNFTVLGQMAGFTDQTTVRPDQDTSNLISANILSGYPNGSFRPEKPVTKRTEFAKMVVVAFFFPSETVPSFSDFLNRTILLGKTTPFLTQPIKTQPTPTEVLLDQKEQQLLTLLYRERQANQLPAILLDRQLMEFAQSYAQEMSTNSYFTHNSSVSGSYQQRVCTHFNQGFTLIGGNLRTAMDPGTKYTFEQIVGNLHQDYMGSSGHRANVLGNWTHAGFSFHQDGSLFLILEVFGNR